MERWESGTTDQGNRTSFPSVIPLDQRSKQRRKLRWPRPVARSFVTPLAWRSTALPGRSTGAWVAAGIRGA